jgi:CheY-like chemotaxis protein
LLTRIQKSSDCTNAARLGKFASVNEKVKVLIADDSPDIVGRLNRMLSDLDYVQVVGIAGDGRRALELYERQKPHIAVLDFQMPCLNGLEVLKTIRARDASFPVIILTNVEGEEIRERCLEAGANSFLHKASEFEQVVDIIGKFHRGINSP